jgi:hypothetical protein
VYRLCIVCVSRVLIQNSGKRVDVVILRTNHKDDFERHWQDEQSQSFSLEN